MYPDDQNKPAVGEELNCQATISLLGVYPKDRSKSNAGEEVTDPDQLIEANFDNYLRDRTKQFPGKFIDYDVYTGTWRFKVSAIPFEYARTMTSVFFSSRLNISDCFGCFLDIFCLTYGQDFVYCLKNKNQL